MKRPFKYKTKNGVWYIYYYDESGKRRSFTTGETLAGPANDKLNEFISNKLKPPQKSKYTASVFLKSYLDVSETVKTPKTCRSIKTAFNEFIRICGDKPLSQYAAFEIDKFLSRKSKEASVWTARKYRMTLNAAFNKAMEWNIIIENPFKKVIKIKKPVYDILYFEKQDFNKFIEAVNDDYLKDIYIFAVLSGLRLSEIVRLKVRDISIPNKLIFVESTSNNPTKDKESRNVELNPHLIPLMKKYINRNGDLILFEPVREIKDFYTYVEKKFKKFIRIAGLNEKFHFHSLRSTFGMWLLDAGVNLKFISQQLGHARLSTTEDYYAKYITSRNKGLNTIDYK